MPFIKHNKRVSGRMGVKDTHVSVGKAHIGIPSKFIKLHWNDCPFSEVYFDEEKGLVGIGASPNDGYKIKRDKGVINGCYQIHPRAFLVKHGIVKGVYSAIYDENEGLLVFKPERLK